MKTFNFIKKIFLVVLVGVVVLGMYSCTEQERVKNLGGKITDIDYDRNEAKVTFTGIINIWLQFYHIDFPNTATPEKYVLITDIVNILDNIKTRAWDYQYLDDNLIEEIINKCKEKSVYFTQY